MHVYEIRVLSAGKIIAVIEEMHLNDRSAIRSAKKFGSGKPFEVWCGPVCVYGGSSASRDAKIP
jgi:hypothetical protein